MSQIQNIITEYLNSSYESIKWLDKDETVLVARSIIDGSFYVIKLEKYYDLDVYKCLKKVKINGIPEIFELLETDYGLLIIEEYIDGICIDDLQNDMLNDNNADDFIIDIGVKLCNILSEIHSMTPPIIHRDIKPQNIIINNENVYLIDFNISREYSGKSNKDTFIMGTQEYAAPEQYGFSESDVRTDIYGLGGTLKTLYDQLSLDSSVISAVISKATAFSPENRYQNADDMKNALLCKENTFTSKLKKYALPGFRSGNILHISISLPVYLFSIYVLVGFEMGNNHFSGFLRVLYDFLGGLFLGLIGYSVLFFSFDYLKIRSNLFKKINFTQSGFIKILFIVLIDIIIAISLFIIYILVAIMIFGVDKITAAG